jgi:hypothetical protein
VLAVFGRIEPRVFLDLAAVGSLFGLTLSMNLDREEDPGFDRTRSAEALRCSDFRPAQEFHLADSDRRAVTGDVSSWVALAAGLDPSRGLDRG